MVIKDDERFTLLDLRKKTAILNLFFKEAYENEEESDVKKIMEKYNFLKMGFSKESYLRYVKSFEKLLYKINDPVCYLQCIKTLDICYANMGLKYKHTALSNAFVKVVKKVEQNVKGYKLWMKDALTYNLITKKDYDKLISNAELEKYENEIAK